MTHDTATVHSWTRLPPLPLRGVETAMVESLDFYVLRLAEVSGNSARALFDVSRADAEERANPGGALSIIAPAPYLDKRVGRLEQITGQSNLRCGTFWPFVGVLSRLNLRATTQRRWCPECYLHWDQDTSCEPLAWQLSMLQLCPEHGCALVITCAKCGASQKQFTHLCVRHRCGNCGGSLGWVAPSARHALSNFEQWADRQACDILSMCADPWQERISGDAFIRYLGALRKITAGLHNEYSRAWVRAKLQGYLKRGSLPTLRTLVSFAALQGVSVREILTHPEDAGTYTPLFGTWSDFRDLPSADIPLDDRIAVATRYMNRLLRLAPSTYLPPLSAVLQFTKADRRALIDKNRRLVRDYLEIYAWGGTGSARRRLSSAFGRTLRSVRSVDSMWMSLPQQDNLAATVSAVEAIPTSDAQRVVLSALILTGAAYTSEVPISHRKPHRIRPRNGTQFPTHVARLPSDR